MAPPLDRRCDPLWRSPCRLRDLRRYRRSRQLKIIREYKCVFLTCVLPRRPPFAPSIWLVPSSSAPCRPDENTSWKFAIPYTVQNKIEALAKRSYTTEKLAARSLSLAYARGRRPPDHPRSGTLTPVTDVEKRHVTI